MEPGWILSALGKFRRISRTSVSYTHLIPALCAGRKTERGSADGLLPCSGSASAEQQPDRDDCCFVRAPGSGGHPEALALSLIHIS